MHDTLSLARVIRPGMGPFTRDFAKRLQIEREGQKAGPFPMRVSGLAARLSAGGAPRQIQSKMISYSDLARVSLRQVSRQKSYGVMVSIALGITAFIALAVLGQEIRYKVGQDMVLMGGVNVMRVTMEDRQYPGQPQREFYPDSIEGIRALQGVEMVSVSSRNAQHFNLKGSNERTLGTLVYGVDELFIPAFSVDVIAGRGLTREDMERRRRVCVMGRQRAEDLYGSDPNAALGQLLFVGQDVLEVVGVISGVMLGDWSECCFMPYTTFIDRQWGDARITRLFVRAVGWEDVPRLANAIPQVIHSHQSAPYLFVQTRDDQLVRLEDTFMWVQSLLWLGIIASLMLGGFGIWYGTFAAVRARTREVGLKKAMGGSDRDIMAQFLCEALCKSVAGGVLGIILGVGSVVGGVIALGTNVPVIQLILSCTGSIVFSAIIGVAGGIYPAIQASRMDVVSALRFE